MTAGPDLYREGAGAYIKSLAPVAAWYSAEGGWKIIWSRAVGVNPRVPNILTLFVLATGDRAPAMLPERLAELEIDTEVIALQLGPVGTTRERRSVVVALQGRLRRGGTSPTWDFQSSMEIGSATRPRRRSDPVGWSMTKKRKGFLKRK